YPWFHPELRSIVFDAPEPSTWIVLERVNEHEHQRTPNTLLLSPIPLLRTGARNTTPPELVVYKTLTDKQSRVTPRLLRYREEKQQIFIMDTFLMIAKTTVWLTLELLVCTGMISPSKPNGS
ncbi:hypothetical protein N7495_009080, partial [Penicillium taxi]|uniref:uncharacterized protein n=1 Tax=Penicillium taxi TaxID=168475 RepID=UPI002544F785